MDLFLREGYILLGLARDYFQGFAGSLNTTLLFSAIDSEEFFTGRFVPEDNNDRPHFIFNEFLARRLLKEVDASVPKLHLWKNKEGRLLLMRQHFSEAKNYSALCNEDLSNIVVNLPDLYYMFVFDTLSCNDDRHDKNMLFVKKDSKNYKLYLIDHEMCFTGRDGIPHYKDKISHYPVDYWTKRKSIQKLKEYIYSIDSVKTAIVDLQNIKQDLINDVYSACEPYLDVKLDMSNFLEQYVRQTQNLDDIIKNISSIFPKAS